MLDYYHFQLPNRYYCFFLLKIFCFWMLSSTFDCFIHIIFRFPFGGEYYTVFDIFILPFNDLMNLCFHYIGVFLFRSKNQVVFSLINQLNGGTIIKKGVNRCSSYVIPLSGFQILSQSSVTIFTEPLIL